MSLYLVPATRENLERSIEKGVAPDEVAPHIPESELLEIQSRARTEGIRCWAMTAHNRSFFNAMQPGDIVLLTEKGTRVFTHFAQVTYKLKSQPLGDALWPFRGDNAWELIYFLRNIRRIHVPKSEFVTKLGYKANYEVAGTLRVPDDRIETFELLHGPLTEFLEVPYAYDAFAQPLGELHDGGVQDYSAADKIALARRRHQHERFAREVKSNYQWRCAMCGIAEPDFLVAGHIVPWAEDAHNRLNPANGLCLCVLHDRAFERGFLFLDEELHIQMNSKLSPTSRLGMQLSSVVGQRIHLPAAAHPAQHLLKRHRDRFL